MEVVRQVQLRLVRHVPAHGLLEQLLEIRLRSLGKIKSIRETYENFCGSWEAFRQHHFSKNFPLKRAIVKQIWEILGEGRANLQEEKLTSPPSGLN